MGKVSGYGSDTTPSLSDYLLGNAASGPTTQRFTLGNVFSLLQKTRFCSMTKGADNTGNAVLTQNLANEIRFTGTVTQYGHVDCIVPQDYVPGTNATVVLILYSDAGNNQTINYYASSYIPGATYVGWNLYTNLTTGAGVGLSANVISTFSLFNISSTNLSAGATIATAFRPSSAVSGNLYINEAYLSYTASV